MALLHFQRCDRFYEITNENLELAACRQELEAAEFSVDLGVHNFGISEKGGLPRTLCNVQAVVNASAKGSASSDPRGAKGSASSDPPCSPCACAPWMTRKHSKRAHTNSRRSRSRHVALGRRVGDDAR